MIELIFGILSIMIALYIFYNQNKETNISRNNNTNALNNSNKIMQAKIYLENLAPLQKNLRNKIILLKTIYENDYKNLHLKRTINYKLTFDDIQSDFIFNNKSIKKCKFSKTVYIEFKELLPEVKNLFPHSYTYYWNFIKTLDPILFYATTKDKRNFDITDKYIESIKLLNEFIELSYNLDTELKIVW